MNFQTWKLSWYLSFFELRYDLIYYESRTRATRAREDEYLHMKNLMRRWLDLKALISHKKFGLFESNLSLTI